MNTRSIAVLGLLGIFSFAAFACSTPQLDAGTEPNVSNDDEGSEPATDTDDNKPSADGGGAATPAKGDAGSGKTPPGHIATNGGHVAANLHCCFGGEYLECPSDGACFGNFDLAACIAAASCGTDKACMNECSKQRSATAPVGCTQKAAPPNIVCNATK